MGESLAVTPSKPLSAYTLQTGTYTSWSLRLVWNSFFENLKPPLRHPCPRWGRGRVRFLWITEKSRSGNTALSLWGCHSGGAKPLERYQENRFSAEPQLPEFTKISKSRFPDTFIEQRSYLFIRFSGSELTGTSHGQTIQNIHMAVRYRARIPFRDLDSDRHRPRVGYPERSRRNDWECILRSRVRSLLLLLPTILLILSVIGAYRQGKVLGLVSVVIAYMAGLVILVTIMTSLVLLGIAIITGYLATNRRLRKNSREPDRHDINPRKINW